MTRQIKSILINKNDYGCSDSLASLCMYIIGHNENQAALNRLCWFVGESVTSIEVLFRSGYFVGYYDKINERRHNRELANS